MDFPDLPYEDAQDGITFSSISIDFHAENEDDLVHWLNNVAASENKKLENLSYIFCSDEYLHKINVDFLDHDTLTDIITFELGDATDDNINGEIYISIDRVRDNAISLSQDFLTELKRVLVHGLLHLCGYPDKSNEEAMVMRGLEDKYIKLSIP